MSIFAVACALAVAPAVSTASTGRHLTLTLGSSLMIKGQTGSNSEQRTVGPVLVRGSWDGGPRFVLTSTRTDQHGHYRFSIRPSHKGVLTMQISPPDRRPITYVLRIV
jgi:hypothetical protein